MITLLLILIIRALKFKPHEEKQVTIEKIDFDKDKAVKDFQDIIRCKTVSYRDTSREDDAEFEKIEKLIKERFPNIIKNSTFERVGRRGLLYRIKGKSSANPSVLMSHFDVVPVNEDLWSHDAFDAEIREGEVWGRGTLDTKITLNGALQGVEHHLKNGFVPKDDIYLAFSGEEETSGTSALDIVDLFIERGVDPKFVLDEGGAVVSGVFPGVSRPCAAVGIAEKGMFNLKYSVKSTGGHASTPPPETPIGILSNACAKIEKNPLPLFLSKPTQKTFDTMARHSNFAYRLIFANLWLFKGIIDKIAKKTGGQMNAMLRTTVAFTQMEGSKAMNVLPPEAYMLSNQRVIPGSSIAETVEQIKEIVNDDRIEYEVIAPSEPSRVSKTDCEGYQALTETISQVYTDAIVAPYLMTACSDSRHYSKLSDKVYRFSPMQLTSDELKAIHGNDEKISVENVVKCAEFYIRLVEKL
ncbi:MAG TPA: M20/M25/M40 family metallo-hydrolase [Clostridiales bacterium]|nr:M20/M25/M40 family metallo-hydrolase [Clostridiales bacterium]